MNNTDLLIGLAISITINIVQVAIYMYTMFAYLLFKKGKEQ